MYGNKTVTQDNDLDTDTGYVLRVVRTADDDITHIVLNTGGVYVDFELTPADVETLINYLEA